MNIGNFDPAAFGLGGTTPGATGADADSQDTFLTLMMTQLQHQDPFQPLESAEFLSQLAQFETAAGINGLQQSFAGLADAMYSNQVLESAALVGQTVLAQMDSAHLGNGTVVNGALDVPGGASAITIEITDASGQLVRTLRLPQGSGRVDFQWDGYDDAGDKALPGEYGFAARAAVDGADQAVPLLLSDVVRSVSLAGSGQPPLLNLAGGAQISFARIVEIS